MSISVPTAGTPILDTWGAAVANQLNTMLVIGMTSDQSTNNSVASGAAVTELQWPATSGTLYVARLFGSYYCNATNQGLQLGFTAPAGSGIVYMQIAGSGTATATSRHRTTAGTATYTGRTTVDSAGSNREWWADIRYVPSASGTIQLTFARGGTSGAPGVTLRQGSGGMVYQFA